MRSKQISDAPKTFVIILDTGEEILSSLKSVAHKEHLTGSSFKAIGALSEVELGWFNWNEKDYETAVKLHEQVEMAFSNTVPWLASASIAGVVKRA